MNRRSSVVSVASACVVALGLGLVGAGSSSAAGDGGAQGSRQPSRFGQLEQVERRVLDSRQAHWLPEGARTARSVRALVVFETPSVSEVGTDRVARADARRSTRDVAANVAAEVRARGGAVHRRFETAISAVSVTVDADDVAALRELPGVASVQPVRRYTVDNATSNAYTRVPGAWTAFGITGVGQTIAIIDDGIDYTHADFGGSGDPTDYAANDRTVVEAGTFPTTKIVGGWDFVGDDYDADADLPTETTVPAPDPDPLACGEHGTHVAGTAAGQGVVAGGATYTGPYTQAAIDATTFSVAPGSAPEAELLAYKVFGCDGSVTSDIILAAIDRAVAEGADVINMSLGSTWGRPDEPDAIAVDNAMRAGVMVVMSAGNSGPSPYQVGGPSTARLGLSVAAVDAIVEFPGATLDPAGAAIAAINANAAPLPVTAPVKVIDDGFGGVSLGCAPEDFAGSAGSIAVVVRGTCARIDKAANGEAAGAAAVVMINNGDGLPPFEGSIPGVSIPFIGVDPADADALLALDGTSITIEASGIVANPGYQLASDFTSGGPRSGDSGVKPDVAAPGVSITSAARGTGTEPVNLSGTSMSSPHTAGIAALVRQAHPEWTPAWVKAALVNTANNGAAVLADFDPALVGNGVVDARAAVRTRQLLVTSDGQQSVGFGLANLTGGFDRTRIVRLANPSSRRVRYDLGASFFGDSFGAKITVTPSHVTFDPHERVQIRVRLRISPADAAAIPVDEAGGLTTIRARVWANPTSSHASFLSLPVLLVPHPRSDVRAELHSEGETGTIDVKNVGFVGGEADVHTLLLTDPADPGNRADARALGYQSFEAGDVSPVPDDRLMVFTFNLHSRFSNAADSVYEFYMDIDGDGIEDKDVFLADEGLVLAGDPNGVLDTFVFDLNTGDLFITPAFAPMDNSTVSGLAFASDLGLSAANPRGTVVVALTYWLGEGAELDLFDNLTTIDAYLPQTSHGEFVPLAPGDAASIPVWSRPPDVGEIPALGWMVVTVDDRPGGAQAALLTPAG